MESDISIKKRQNQSLSCHTFFIYSMLKYQTLRTLQKCFNDLEHNDTRKWISHEATVIPAPGIGIQSY